MKTFKFTILLLLYIIQPIVYAQDKIIPVEPDVLTAGHQLERDYESLYSPENISKKIYGIRNFNTTDRDKSGKSSAQLGSFWIYGNTLYYRLKINNRSNIN